MPSTSGWPGGLYSRHHSKSFQAVLLAVAFSMSCIWGFTILGAQQPGNVDSPSPAEPQDDSATPADDAGETSEEQAELLPEIAQAIVEQTNAFRQRNDQKPLSNDDDLAKTTEEFAKFMATHDKYGHRADGRTPAERAKASGYDYCLVRENIAFRQGTELEDQSELTETFVEGWIESDRHRENMLADYITETGTAVATTDQSTFYAVQMFGRPKSLRFQIELTNQTEETQELVLEHDGGTDSFELPARVRLKVTRCLPTNFTLNDGEQALTLRESAELAIVTNADNVAELRRVKSSDE